MANIYKAAGAALLVAGFGAVIATAMFSSSAETTRTSRDFDWPRAELSSRQTTPRDFDWPGGALDRQSSDRDFDYPAGGLGTASSDAPRDPRMAEAEGFMRSGAWAEAARVLNSVVADRPDNADAYSDLGYCNRMLGDRDQALAQFGRALAIDPTHRGALEYLGKLYLEMRDLPKAKEQLGALARLCGGACGEYRGLQEEVQKFKANDRRG
jgi:tetratricopeptide (TPR) repeat protein